MLNKRGFREENVTSQQGKTVLVTGADSGIGFEVSRVMAANGARVLMASISQELAENAMKRIKAIVPSAELRPIIIDLGDLESVKAAAKAVLEEPKLDILINNAGIMIPPYGKTKDGFESQFGINHLGHFALTGLLLEKLFATPDSRIVTACSMVEKFGEFNYDDIHAEKEYKAFDQYAMSKLSNLIFAYELQRRLDKAGRKTISVATHPGVAANTNLSQHFSKWFMLLEPVSKRLGLVNTADSGAWPILCASTAEFVKGGDYYGPKRFFQFAGPAVKVKSGDLSYDLSAAKKLWDMSVEMTGIDPMQAVA
ncbi:oxidoreductase [Maricurvus nonylphenolicus]|uniref:oxidoreductase n=1 Tax=Maricurvus nonylphenolicus TaxID=1008307 RepID=UPI0036F1EE11